MNKLAKFGMLGWTILCFLGSCSGMMNVARSTEGRQLGGAESLGVGIGLFMWLIIWAVPMVVLGIIALVTKPKSVASPAYVTEAPSPILCPHCGKYYAGSASFCPICGGAQINKL